MIKILTKTRLIAMLLVFITLQSFAQAPSRLIGTAIYGGEQMHGTIFSINSDGGDVTVLHNFDGTFGALPEDGLIQASNGLLFGVTSQGGATTGGTIYKIKADGSGFGVILSFSIPTGVRPTGALLQGADGYLYGMTYLGGGNGNGTVFKVDLKGQHFTILHNFTEADGGHAYASLIQLPNGKLYGTLLGTADAIFSINPDGTGYTTVVRIPRSGTSLLYGMDGKLYGVGNQGKIFTVNPDGSNLTIASTLSANVGNPQSALIQTPTGALYGTAYSGGLHANGTIYKLNPDGSGAVALYHFNGADGAHPVSGLTYNNNKLFGCTSSGGSNNRGAVFNYNLSTGVYTLMASLSTATGEVPWHASLLVVNPALISDTVISSNTITFSNVFSTTMRVDFIAGTGSKHLAILKANSAPDFIPVNNMAYSGDLGNGQSVAYNGTESNFILTGLQPDTEYYLTIFDYNEDGTTTKYATSAVPTANRHTQVTVDQLIGTTSSKGSLSGGTIYKFNTDPIGNIEVIKNFVSITGAHPHGQLIQATDEWLYGMTQQGVGEPDRGGAKFGAIFKINPDGTNYTLLHSLLNQDGIYPEGALLQASNGSLYGMCTLGGLTGMGTVFKIETNGSGFTVLHHFMNGPDGRVPHGSLIQATDGNLYGMVGAGGVTQLGLIFRITLAGEFSVVHNFTAQYAEGHYGSLIQGADGFLYGTITGGGTANPGSVFKVNLDGSSFTTIYNFTSVKEGAPHGSLVQTPDGTLYGTAVGDATNTSPNGYGTIFKINSDGSGYAVIHYFDRINGSGSSCDLTYHNNKLYGFTSAGGESDVGVVFNYDLTTSSFQKLTDFNDATGRIPASGRLLFIHGPAGEMNYVVNPTDKSSGHSLSPNIMALEVPGATSYTIELNKDKSFDPATAMVKTGGRTISFPGLSMGTTYYTRVKTDAIPYWGPTREFTTGDVISFSYIISPSNNTTNTSWNPIVKVNPIPSVTTYTVQLSTSYWFTGPSIEMTGNTTSFNFTGLAQNTTYYARVTTNLSGGSWGAGRTFSTGSAQSLTYVSTPRNSSVDVNVTKDISANLIPDATSYTIQLSELADFSIVDFEQTGATNTLSFSGLKYNTTYYNRVRTNLSPEFGTVLSFITLSPEDLAYVTSPINNTSNIKVNKLNITSKPVPGATWYTIQLSVSADFSTIAFTASGPERTLAFNGLAYNTKYYCRVLTNLTSVYGPVHNFTTTTGTVSAREMTELTTEKEGLTILTYPNPFQEKFTVYVGSSSYDQASISLLDMSGKFVHESTEKTNTSIEIAKPLATGVYFLRLQVGGNVRVVKVIKVH